jgi:hypothetical protein
VLCPNSCIAPPNWGGPTHAFLWGRSSWMLFSQAWSPSTATSAPRTHSSQTEVHSSVRELDEHGWLWSLSLKPYELNFCLLSLVPNWLSWWLSLRHYNDLREKVNIYRDPKYAFLILRAHAALWKEWGLLITTWSPIKHSKEILKLLKVALLPKQIGVIHCPKHQRSVDQVAKGNQSVDKCSKGDH